MVRPSQTNGGCSCCCESRGYLRQQHIPADFLLENIKIQNTCDRNCMAFWVRRLLFLGSSCIYPKFAEQPIKEEMLLTGSLEPTNEWYAIAKITGIKLCEALRKQHDFDAISLMPTNLYGPGTTTTLKIVMYCLHLFAAFMRQLKLELQVSSVGVLVLL